MKSQRRTDKLKPALIILLLLAILGSGIHSARAFGESLAPLTASLYPRSTVITGVSFDWSTHKRLAAGSDNWPITWADDDNQYSSWGDGGGFGGSNDNGRVSLGFARIEGSASSYRGVNAWGGVSSEASAQFPGKSYGVLGLNSKLYAWRCGDGSMSTAYLFQRLYESPDHGRTWNYTGVEYTQGYFGSTRGFFCPTFLQFGKNYTGARDSYVYSYAPEIKTTAWDTQKPGEISLLRVPVSGLKDRSQYQFFAGLDGSGNATWTTNAASRKPVFADGTNGVALASATYNAGLKRYLLVVAHSTRASGNIGIYDSANPWGPWTTVLFTNGWGSPNIEASTFFWNFSNKWTSVDGKDFTFVFSGTGTNDSWNTVQGHFSTTSSLPLPAPTATPIRTALPTATQALPTIAPAGSGFPVKINFQPASAPVPSGYKLDSGAVYGSRGNGYTYGWNVDTQANTRDRNSSLSPDQASDTLNHLQKDGQSFVWELAVPNGAYQVRLSAGDAGYYDSVYKLNAEGVLAGSGTPTSTSRWVTGAAVVNVSDGRLTIASAAGAVNNKINWVEVSVASAFPAPTATQPGPTPTAGPTRTPAPTAVPTQPPAGTGFSARVNFQPAAAAVPAGYLSDTGLAFGDRGGGYSYGWNADTCANARERSSSLSSDKRYDTLNHLQKDGSSFTWEIALPNGTYRVQIVAGDAGFYDSVYKINAEGVLVVNGTPNSTSRWVSGTATVTVSDGRLTISNGSGAANNKIDFIEITAP